MPSPILHAAVGASFAIACPRADRRWLADVLIVSAAALLPDLDVLPGLILDDPNRFHGDWSHSLAFAVLVGMVASRLSRACRTRVGLMAGFACATHPLLDALVVDGRPPIGVPILWPLSDWRLHLDPPILPGLHHGLDGVTASDFFSIVFSTANLTTIGVEMAIAFGVLTIAALLGRRLRRRRAISR